MGGRGAGSASSNTTDTEKLTSALANVEADIGISDSKNLLSAHAKALGVSEAKAQVIIDDIYDWTGSKETINGGSKSTYEVIREYQKTGNIPKELKSRIERVSNSLEEYINKAPDVTERLYRGVTLHGNDLKTVLKKGNFDINGGATASWSSDINQGALFAGMNSINHGGTPVVFIDTGTHKNTASVTHLSKYKDEKEVLSSKNNKYRITEVKEKSWDTELGKVNGYYVYVKAKIK